MVHDPKVAVVAGARARAVRVCDGLPLFDLLTFVYSATRIMSIVRFKSPAVIDHNKFPVPAGPPRTRDRTRCRRLDLGIP